MKVFILLPIVLIAYVAAFLLAVEAIQADRSPSVPFEKTFSRISGAKQSLDFWTLSRAYPESDIPDEAFYTAFEYLQRDRQTRQGRPELTSPWRAIGPHNIGGRTLAIAFNPLNPNTIYAGSASGGLWRSNTGGIGAAAWQNIATGFPVLGVSSIAIHPADSNTIYIGTGEVYGYQNAQGNLSIRTTRGSYGLGVLKTTDGGNSWVKSLDWSYNQKRGVQVVKLNPQNPNSIWAATTEGTYLSRDAGATWFIVHNVTMVMDIAINPLDTNIVFIGVGNLGSAGRGIYRTTDGGTVWVMLTAGLPVSFNGKIQLSIYQSSPNVVFASIGGGSTFPPPTDGTWLCRSTNNGDTWTIVSAFDYSRWQGWYSHYAAVHPVDSSKVICGGIDLWKSTTGGTNLIQKSDWTTVYYGTPPPGAPQGPPNYAHGDHHALAFHPTNPDIIYFVCDGGVFRSTNGGETFAGCNGGFQTTQFYNGFACAFTDSILSLGGLQDNFSAIYQGTVAWRRVMVSDGAWAAIHPTNPDTMFASWYELGMGKSTNRGSSWFNITPPASTITSFIAPYVLSPSSPRILYAGRDKVFKSTTGGGSWLTANGGQPLDGNPLISMAISFTSPDTVYAGTAPVNSRARIFRTTNGGASWTNITSSLPDRYPVDIAVDPGNSAVVYVAFSGFGTSHLFKSTDAGMNWTDIGVGLPDVPTSAVVIDPDYRNHIYVGNDLGVFLSTDNGASWQEFRTGMPDAAIVMDLAISRRNRALRAATHGNGVYERRLVDAPVSVTERGVTATSFRLEQNYPNPFNPTTEIKYSIPKSGMGDASVSRRVSDASRVTLKIYDVIGREVATIVDEAEQPGTYTVQWNAAGFASGIYIYRLRSGEFIDAKKLVLLR